MKFANGGLCLEHNIYKKHSQGDSIEQTLTERGGNEPLEVLASCHAKHGQEHLIVAESGKYGLKPKVATMSDSATVTCRELSSKHVSVSALFAHLSANWFVGRCERNTEPKPALAGIRQANVQSSYSPSSNGTLSRTGATKRRLPAVTVQAGGRSGKRTYLHEGSGSQNSTVDFWCKCNAL